MSAMDPLWWTLGSVFLVSAVSLVGTAAFALQEIWLRRALFALVGLAAGALLGDALLHLIPHSFVGIGSERGFGLAVLLGIVLLFVLEKYLRWHHAHHGREEDHAGHEHYERGTHDPHGHLAPLVIVADGLHNMVDGAVIAASYIVSPALGIATTIAVFLHEIPQEVSDYALLIHAGYSRVRALLWNFLSGLTAFLGAGIVFVFGAGEPLFGYYAAAVTAGAFIYLAAADLIPELHQPNGTRASLVSLITFLIGIALMVLLTYLEA
jgi:zinc and cadmium transporter